MPPLPPTPELKYLPHCGAQSTCPKPPVVTHTYIYVCSLSILVPSIHTALSFICNCFIESVEVVDGKVTVCRDAVKGKCTRPNCKYYHPVVSSSAAAASSTKTSRQNLLLWHILWWDGGNILEKSYFWYHENSITGRLPKILKFKGAPPIAFDSLSSAITKHACNIIT